jgi:hypothetical protein
MIIYKANPLKKKTLDTVPRNLLDRNHPGRVSEGFNEFSNIHFASNVYKGKTFLFFILSQYEGMAVNLLTFLDYFITN